MLTWITGRSGTGKTTRLMQDAKELTAQYAQVFLLVPEQSSMTMERAISQKNAQSPVQVVSFRRMCNVIFRRFGGVAGQYMTRTREIALITKIMQQHRRQLHYYRAVRPTMGFVSALQEAFVELTQAGLTREQLFPVLRERGRQDWIEKYEDLFTLYEAYQQALSQDCRSAQADLDAAVSLAAERRFFQNTAVLVDGFFGFTGQQRAMLRVMMEQCGLLEIALLEDLAENSLLFSAVLREKQLLNRAAEECRCAVKEETLCGPSRRLQEADLQELERRLFREGPQGADPIPSPHVHLLEGRNIREELAMVAVDIARKVREQGKRYRDFALIVGNLEPYGNVAEMVFARYGVPLFVDQGKNVLSKPLFAFIQAALRMVSPERPFRQEDMLLFLKTGLAGEERDLISRLENYCVLWQINGERFVREEDWTQNPKGLGKIDEEGVELLAALNALRRRVSGPLLRLRVQVRDCTGVRVATGIYQLLQDFQVEQRIRNQAEAYFQQVKAQNTPWEVQQSRRQSEEYLRLYRVMIDILDEIYETFGEEPVSLSAMEELIGLCGEETALSLTPPTLDSVTIGEVTHSRLDAITDLYVVGANQGILPMPAGDRSLISDRERQWFAAHRLPCNATLQQNTVQGQYRLYAALFSTRKQLTFSYSAFQMDGSANLPSVYVDRIRQLCGIAPIRREQMNLYDFALTPDGVRELIGWAPALQETMLREIGEDPRPEKRPEEQLPDAVVRQIFGRHLRLSYSQIRLYQNCPFHYFMEKTMGLRPLAPITFDKANIGTFVHYGLEQLMRAIRADQLDYKMYNKDKIQQFGSDTARKYLEDQLRDMQATYRFQTLYRRMTRLFCHVAENVVGELSAGRYLPFGEEVSLAGTVLPLGDGREAELIGVADRVDYFEADGRTYLKVTDYKTGPQSFDLRGLTNREGVQLPLYLYGLIKSGRWQQPVPAAGCYLEAKLPVFAERCTEDALSERVRAFYKRGGLFTTDERALQALDQHGGADYFKLSYKNDGSLSQQTKAYEPAQLQEMVDYMETVILDTARGIFSGNCKPHPLKGKTHDACRNCDYMAVCGYQENEGKARLYSEDPEGWRKERGQP